MAAASGRRRSSGQVHHASMCCCWVLVGDNALIACSPACVSCVMARHSKRPLPSAFFTPPAFSTGQGGGLPAPVVTRCGCACCSSAWWGSKSWWWCCIALNGGEVHLSSENVPTSRLLAGALHVTSTCLPLSVFKRRGGLPLSGCLLLFFFFLLLWFWRARRSRFLGCVLSWISFGLSPLSSSCRYPYPCARTDALPLFFGQGGPRRLRVAKELSMLRVDVIEC